MNETRNKAIMNVLEAEIRSGQYSDKLPPLRTLAARFDVSLRTVQKALRPLCERGMLVPGGPRGIFINSRRVNRPRTGVAGIFAGQLSMGLDCDPLLTALWKAAAADGYTPLIMNLPGDKFHYDINFWRSNYVDGYIFVYSSFDRNLANQLTLNDIPFIAANHLPGDYGASWVGFDEQLLFRRIAGLLRSAGIRRIALDFPSRLHCYLKCRDAEWSLVAGEMNLGNYPVGVYDVDVDGMVYRNAWALAKMPEPPEAIICWGSNAYQVQQAFEDVGRKVIIVSSEQFDKDEPGMVGLGKVPYPWLASETWELFKTVLDNPLAETMTKRLDFSGQVLDEAVFMRRLKEMLL